MPDGAPLPLLLPVRSLATAKRRLGAVMVPHARRRLVLAMLADVLAAGQEADLVPIVLSPDDNVLDFADCAGATVLREPPGRGGLNRALAWALEHLASAPGVLILLPDTPLVTTSELRAVASAGPGLDSPRPETSKEVIAAPDRAGRGTNALLLRPPTLLKPVFGVDSLARHEEAARRSGASFSVVELPGIALDLDTPADLDEFLRAATGTRTRRALEEIRSLA